MKAIYLIGSVVFTIVILIVAFSNLNSTCSNLKFLTFSFNLNCSLEFLIVSTVGILAGLLYHAFVRRVLDTPPEGEQGF